MPNDESSLESLLAAAIEIADEGERERYLGRVCAGDTARLAELQRMVHDYYAASSLIDRPAAFMPTIGHQPPMPIGQQVGPYTLRELLGEGGMGSVYVAQQERPVRRKVALKIIKPGMDSREVISRFEAERQALALMDHPHIAKVLEAGTTENGRPYFVMELVRGLPITEHCDALKLGTHARLQLFQQVCQAVQHAHQKGIIHRDLKPSNVIVAMHDTTPVVKVIDFGVAKAIGQQLTDHTLYTGFSQMIGTPLYMSPEQAGQSSLDVDTRSDVYSLGVLLYELLTGSTPFESAALRKVGVDEMRRIIREVEPPRPSGRVSTLEAEALTTISERRQIEPRHLSRELRGELDWIVMKALEKDRNRRYETANELAMDIQRYLSDESVRACPPSVWYGMRKAARRHRAALTTVALVGLALLAGTVVSGWQAIRATQAGALARQREEEARDAAAESKAVLEFFIRDVLGAANPAEAKGRDLTFSEALAHAEKKLGATFTGQPLIEASVRHSLALTYRSLGRYDLARQHATRCLDLRRRLLGPQHPGTLAAEHVEASLLVDSGAYDEAHTLLARVLEVRRRVLGPDHPDTLRTMDALGGTYLKLGNVDDAHKLCEQVLEVRRRVLGPEHPDTLVSIGNLAVVLGSERKHDESRKLQEAVLAIRRHVHGPEHPETLLSMNALAVQDAQLGKLDEANALFEQTLEIRRRITGPEHPDTLCSMQDLAVGFHRQGKCDEARALAEKATEIGRRTLGPEHPLTLEAMRVLAMTLHMPGKHHEARALLEQLVETQRRVLGPEHPKTLFSMYWLASVLYEQSKDGEAMGLLEQTLERQRRVLGPKDKETLLAMNLLVECLAASPVASSGDLSRALEFTLKVVELSPENGMARQSLGWIQYRLGDWKGCIESLKKRTDSSDDSDFFKTMAHWQLGEKAQARSEFKRADTWLKGYEQRCAEREKQGKYMTPRPRTLQRIRAEAAALLGLDLSERETPTATESMRTPK